MIMRANIVLGALAVVLGIWVAVVASQQTSRFTAYEDEPMLFEGLDADRISKIGFGIPSGEAVTKPDGTVEVPRDEIWFEKTDGRWRIVQGPFQGAPVETRRVVSTFIDFAKAIRKLRRAQIIEDGDPAELKDKGCTRDTGRIVQFMTGDEVVASLLVGDYVSDRGMGNALQGYYVRDLASRDVYFHERSQWIPVTDPKRWIDRVLHDFDSSKLQRLSFKGPFGAAAFAPDPDRVSTWKAVEKPAETGAVRQAEVTRLVSEFSRVTAHDIAGRRQEMDATQVGWSNPYVHVVATLDDDRQVGLRVLNKVPNSSTRYAITDDPSDPWVWTVEVPVFADYAKEIATTLFDPASEPKDGR